MAWGGAGEGVSLTLSQAPVTDEEQASVPDSLREGWSVALLGSGAPGALTPLLLSPCSEPSCEAAVCGQHPLDPGGSQAPAGEVLACAAWVGPWAVCLPGGQEPQEGVSTPCETSEVAGPLAVAARLPRGCWTEKPRAFQKIAWGSGQGPGPVVTSQIVLERGSPYRAWEPGHLASQLCDLG